MNMLQPSLLLNAVLDFLTTIEECYSSTPFAEDRAVYAADIALVTRWITVIRKQNENETKSLIREIFSTQTDKALTDYWRQGRWGEQEIAGLAQLRKSIADLRELV